jgi:hypothetical protein
MHQSNARSLPAPLVQPPFDFAAGVYQIGDDQARSWIVAGMPFGGSKPRDVLSRIEHVSLATDQSFQEIFIQQTRFPD